MMSTDLIQSIHDWRAGERSPYLTDFENFYRRKLALGQLTMVEVEKKMDQAVMTRGITQEESDHMKAHLIFRPPTQKEIEEAVEQEIQRLEQEQQHRMDEALEAQRIASEQLAEAKRQVSERRKARTQAERGQLMVSRKLTIRGRTLVFGKNGQLYVFQRGKQGRQRMTSYYRKLEKFLKTTMETAKSKLALLRLRNQAT